MTSVELRDRLNRVEKAQRPEGPARELRDRLAGVTGEELVTIEKSELVDLAGVLSALVEAEENPNKLKRLLEKAKRWLADSHLLTNLKVPRVDLVTHPANMRTFLVTKSNPVTGEEDLELYELDDKPPDWWEE